MYFDKLLIANRGEIAVRIIRACRELGIATVAVYSAADKAALHVRLADEAFLLGPATPAESYLHVGRILEAARLSGAQALHPGYGFLSERAEFARACRSAGVVWVGPPAEAIDLMGSKIAAKRLAEQAGVPTVPGYLGDDQRPQQLREQALRVGFPLLIKASAGGGGRGMRVVRDSAAFDEALSGAQREAQASFGDDAVFLERLIERPRHIEIQVLADAHGGCVHLFERECSIQRRHQKIVEESPSTALTPELRAEMGAAAVRLAQAAGYRNAGTLEFMLDELGRYYFLEMNTRLQVEHPVTEIVAGVDLVQLQIAIAAGAALPFAQADLSQRGHAIEVRVYAEDPAMFLPSTGRVALFAPAVGPGIRNDAGLESGDEVSIHYDSMLAKLIVAAPDRASALARLRRALDDYAVLGVTTNLPLLRAIAAHPDFAAGATRTDFLELTALAGADFEPHGPPAEVLIAAAIVDLQSPFTKRQAPRPWRLLNDGIRLRYTFGETEQPVLVTRVADCWRVESGDIAYTVSQIARLSDQLVLEIDGGRIERFVIAREQDGLLIGWRGASYRLGRVGPLSVDALLGRVGRMHGHASLEAPMPGTLIKVLVEEGQPVVARQPLVVLEVMKMEHVVVAPYDGMVVRLPLPVGALVAKGVALVELEENSTA
ncbi:MAG TPA: acetyl-CoA carboxylase biotin carboxylase subunit [Roseiflexaceae bacterium]|nr:acetyl-CoA carboxylase biotin carboxylase subunit [Roseiflexaceae bacterium]